MKTFKDKRGISLIVLVITIILMIILGAAVIISLNGGGTISRANEAVFKNDIKKYQEQLNMAIANEKLNQNDVRDKITAMGYEQDGNPNSVYTYVPDFKKKYEGKLVIKEDFIVYVGLDDKEREWTLNAGIYRSKKNTIKYIDEDGNKLADDDYISQLDVEYVYTAKQINGYMPIIDELSGISNSDTEVTFEYCKICDNLAFVGIDEDGNETETESEIVEYKVTGIGTCTNKNVAIPEVHNSKPVTTIKTDAFKNNATVSKLAIPNSIKYIAGYTSLPTTLDTVNVNAKEIRDLAFWGRTINNVIVGRDVESLNGRFGGGRNLYIFCEANIYGLGTFASCTKIITNKDNNTYTEIDGLLCSKDKKTLIIYPTGLKDEEYIIPSYIENIGAYAFNTYTNIKKLTIPSTVKNVYTNAFNSTKINEFYVDAISVSTQAFRDSSTQKVIIGPNVNNLEVSPFWGCTQLTDVTILSEKSIAYSRAFWGCSTLERFKVGDGNSKYSVTEDGVLIYDGTTLNSYPPGKKDAEYTIPNSIIKIAYQAFAGNQNIEQINMYNSVINIEDYIATSCSKLTNITYYDTMEKWNNIAKLNWKYYSSIKTVTCTDGTIDL